ncbi:hypothetical protein WL48_14850 [Burkholderia ubonensis]|nr:hypothetical protein WL48_14850 [Burkholderia ubonensis]KWC40756.1 hypothetical protein WL49_16065 [Burkholderia ubonensis]OJA98285.1 hypothetical protein BGV48_21020 [Burkholderia ubonensis]
MLADKVGALAIVSLRDVLGTLAYVQHEPVLVPEAPADTFKRLRQILRRCSTGVTRIARWCTGLRCITGLLH